MKKILHFGVVISNICLTPSIISVITVSIDDVMGNSGRCDLKYLSHTKYYLSMTVSTDDVAVDSGRCSS